MTNDNVNETPDLYGINTRLRELAVACQAILERLKHDQSAESWFLDVRFPLKSDNIYEAEFWDKRVKRWVGPDPIFRIKLPLTAAAVYAIQIQTVDFIKNENRNEFALHADGIQISWLSKDDGLFCAEYTALRTGMVELQFSTPHSISPHMTDASSTDQRLLAFSFSHISVQRKEQQDPRAL